MNFTIFTCRKTLKYINFILYNCIITIDLTSSYGLNSVVICLSWSSTDNKYLYCYLKKLLYNKISNMLHIFPILHVPKKSSRVHGLDSATKLSSMVWSPSLHVAIKYNRCHK